MDRLGDRIGIRDLAADDIPAFLDYWYRSPPTYLATMGVDQSKMLPEDQRAAFMERVIRENASRATSSLVWLAVLLDGQIIGTHSVSEVVEHQSAVFHAHLWKPELRGQGIATFTYPRAAKIFAERFDLREVLFKTPVGNVAANRIKEKLGLLCAGQTPVEYDFMLPGVTANVYCWPREAIEAFLSAGA